MLYDRLQAICGAATAFPPVNSQTVRFVRKLPDKGAPSSGAVF